MTLLKHYATVTSEFRSSTANSDLFGYLFICFHPIKYYKYNHCSTNKEDARSSCKSSRRVSVFWRFSGEHYEACRTILAGKDPNMPEKSRSIRTMQILIGCSARFFLQYRYKFDQNDANIFSGWSLWSRELVSTSLSRTYVGTSYVPSLESHALGWSFELHALCRDCSWRLQDPCVIYNVRGAMHTRKSRKKVEK